MKYAKQQISGDYLARLFYTDNLSFITWCYRSILRRLPDPHGQRHYLRIIESGVDRLKIMHQIWDSAESRQLLNYINEPDNKIFIRKAYLYSLFREPDASGEQEYLNLLLNGTSRKLITESIKNSDEHKTSSLASDFINHQDLMTSYTNINKKKFFIGNKNAISSFSLELKLQAFHHKINNDFYLVNKKLDEFITQLYQPKETVVTDQAQYIKNDDTSTNSLAKYEGPTDKFESRDLTWKEFSEQVLLHRKKFKGIFVQEVIIDWNVPLFQRPQHIATALGRLGYLVIYKTGNWGNIDHIDAVRNVCENVWLTSLPEAHEITNAIHSIYSTAHIEPEYFNNIIKDGIKIYEYIDHIDPKISGDIEVLQRLKDWALSGGVDYIVASARSLEKEAVASLGEDRVIYIPNGVDTQHYRNKNLIKGRCPEDMALFRNSFNRIVGYFGAIAPWLWYQEIRKTAELMPDIGFIFIGPDYYGGVNQLPNNNNILHLNSKHYSILPAYAAHFDICWIPFEPGDIAKTTSPLKLFEYFALEKPVVVTDDMQECVIYPEVFKAGNADEFVNSINQAFQKIDDVDHQRRLALLADENDWSQRALKMMSSIKI